MISVDSPLGDDWSEWRLHDLVSHPLTYGIVKTGPSVPGGVPAVRVTDVRDGFIDTSDLLCVSPEVAGQYARSTLKTDDVLLTIQGNLRRSAVVPSELEGANITRSVAVLRFSDAELARWVQINFESPRLQAEFARKSSGSTRAALNLKDLATVAVMLPPAREFSRRLTALENARDLRDAALSEVAKATSHVDAAQSSAVRTLYNGASTASSSTQPLGEVASSSLGKMLDQAKNRGTPRPYLRNANVQWRRFVLDDIQHMRITDEEADRFRVLANDVLICEGGAPGRAAVWTGEGEVYFQKALHRVRCSSDLSPSWLVLALQAMTAQGTLAPYLTGTGILHLTGSSLAKLPLLIPSIAEQSARVAIIDEVFTKSEQTLRLLSATADSAGLAYQALLARHTSPPQLHTDKIEATNRSVRVITGQENPLEYPRFSARGSAEAAYSDADGIDLGSALTALGGTATAAELLAACGAASVDAFYVALRHAVARGELIESAASNQSRTLSVSP